MNLSYALLSLTVMLCLFTKNKHFMLSAIFVTTIAALYEGVITSPIAICAILSLYAMCHTYFYHDTLNKYLRAILFAVIIIFITSFIMHMIPGFSNILVIDKVRVSLLSAPFSMYLNFDKTIIALIIYVTSKLFISETYPDKKSIIQTLFTLLVCVVVILIPGLLLGYIKYDFKIPDILWLWVFNNLLFVTFGEEVIFRGFVQNSLKSFLSTKMTNNHLHVVIASLIFGLSHFKGGIVHIVLASIAGGFYGYTYEKTNRISCAMIVHFGLNLVHLIFFTYPAAMVV